MNQSVSYSFKGSDSKIKEIYIPLWVTGFNGTSSASLANQLVQKGTNALVPQSTGAGTPTRLHTLASGWTGTFALEFTSWASSTYGGAVVTLFDFTTGTYATSYTTGGDVNPTTYRSNAGSLVSGRTYGVTLSTKDTAYTAYLNNAYLVAIL